MKNFSWLFFFFLILFSCNRNSLEKQLVNFIGTEIIFPENLQANLQGHDTLMHFTNAPIKMIVWHDSVGCSSCQIQQMLEWYEIVLYADSIGKIFVPVFIFSPKVSDLSGVRKTLRTTDFEYPIYIDNKNLFFKKNPGIPSDKRLHTFLLDENNKVILAGSPLRNETLWKLYKEQIRSQTER